MKIGLGRMAAVFLCAVVVAWAAEGWARTGEPIKMPNLAGMSQDAARAALWSLGLKRLRVLYTDHEPSQPAQTGQVKSQAPAPGATVAHDTFIEMTIWAGCNQIIGSLSRTNPRTKQRECYCPPNMAVFFWHEQGPKCTECWVHLRYLFRWINDRDWRRAQMIVSRARACKWHGDGKKLLKAAKEFYSQ